MKWIIRTFVVLFAICYLPAAKAQIAAPVVTQVVTSPLIDPATFTLAVTPSSPSLTTQTLAISGAVTGASGAAVPTGTVTVCDGGTGTACTGGLAVGTATLSAAGTFTCSESLMAEGTHTITAHYSGDKKYAASK